MFCAYVLLCNFCILIWGITRSFLGFEHVRAGGGGSVTTGHYRSSLGGPMIGGGGLRELWHVDRGLSWPTIHEFGRLSW